ncbi:phosphate/phosphite/phosphonate ABC transporter substrate-binding protein [Skermanella pratensis]|uniref:phosphate/phosphite/phosphonate ABC transporter substrate-binding protein n=1 Tax=Skermanella pratensis TaxID=2233999 RepID=UPI0017880E3C|nr:PhnD/SsuA/transferrin family substrate-binding protein [Skermanella pratensis]
MYDLPELRDAHIALWSAVARHMDEAGLDGVPGLLTFDGAPADLWQAPDLFLSQTCGLPLVTSLGGMVRVVATPRYRAPGCSGSRHRGFIVVGADSPVQRLVELRGSRCIINGWDSNTGMNMLRAAVAPLARDGRFFGSVSVSGSHLASLHRVADGGADVAAVDCVTFAHLSRHRASLVEGVRVLAVTAATPCLPLVTAAGTDDGTLAALRAALQAAATSPGLSAARADLLLDGFDLLPDRAYRVVTGLAAQAAAVGYPELA